MILTCPECATRYFVEDSRLGTNGRTVRCAACGSSWRAQAEEPLELSNDPVLGSVAREPVSFKPIDEAAPVTAEELPKVFRAKQEQKRRVREAATAGVVWAGMVSAFAALLAAAYVFRVDVVKLYPKAAGAYAMVNVPVNPTGLEFEKVKGEPAPVGVNTILITGQVRNVESEPTTPPPIRVALLDGKGHKLATRVVRLPNKPIQPGKAISFTAAMTDPKAAANDVAVEFALDLAPKPKPVPKAKPKPKPDARKGPKHSVAPPKMTLRPKPAEKAATAPTRTAGGLRPTVGLPAPKPVEAKPLPAGDPYALDTAAAKAVSAQPHG